MIAGYSWSATNKTFFFPNFDTFPGVFLESERSKLKSERPNFTLLVQEHMQKTIWSRGVSKLQDPKLG